LFFAVNFFTGGALTRLLSGDPQPVASQSTEGHYQGSAEEEALVDFVSFALDDAQAVWAQKLAAQGDGYRDAKLVLFTDAVDSGCGYARSAMGPFYCPADEKVYIDLGFYRALKQRFGAPGDFAQVYVLAHEIGHHVQTVLGYSQRMRVQQKKQPSKKNELSVRLELQADCFAGIWAHDTAQRKLLEAGDIAEALRAAEAIGDDRLQKDAGGRVNPETWTHGSSAQRQKWFSIGFDTGKVEACDTFAASSI
jgi:predicted metalloprotease